MKFFKLGSFSTDLLLTTITSAITSVVAIFVTRLLAENLGPDEFGAYSLARRMIATVMPVTTLGMTVAIPRYVAMTSEQVSQSRYFLSGLFLMVLPNLLFLLGGFFLKDHLTLLIFHDSSYELLFLSSLLFIVGYSIYSVLYAYYRGMLWMGRANLWQLFISAVIPLIVVFFFREQGRAELILAPIGFCMFFAMGPLSQISLKSLVQSPKILQLYPFVKEMLLYGAPRVPGAMALGLLFAIGPLLAPYVGSLKEAGYLATGQSVLGVMESGIVAFGLVALPKFAQIAAQKKQETIKKAIENVVTFVLHLGLFATVQGLLWTDKIVLIMLGPQYQEAIPLMRVIFLAVVPYLAYVILRSIIDSVEVRAINTFNILLSLAITVIINILTIILGLGSIGLALGTTVGVLCLGSTTVYFLLRRYNIKFNNMFMLNFLVINFLFLIIGILIKHGVLFLHSFFLENLLIILFLIITFFIYTYSLFFFKVDWMTDLKERIK